MTKNKFQITNNKNQINPKFQITKAKKNYKSQITSAKKMTNKKR